MRWEQWVGAALFVAACGGSHRPAQVAESASSTEEKPLPSSGPSEGGDTPSNAIEAEPKRNTSACTGFDVDLAHALGESVCEVDAGALMKPRDLKGVLEVKVVPGATKVPPGGETDLVVRFTNRSKNVLPLDFILNPVPRVLVETYNAKGVRVDLPATHEPLMPAAFANRARAPETMGRVTLPPNGTAFIKVPWKASKSRWAPEKLRGTPPEEGFPRLPGGPLGKGRYTLKVVTPLLGAVEGADHEVSSPKITIDVGK